MHSAHKPFLFSAYIFLFAIRSLIWQNDQIHRTVALSEQGHLIFKIFVAQIEIGRIRWLNDANLHRIFLSFAVLRGSIV